MAPLRIATAVIQDSCTSVRPNSLRIGIPSTPNINHTANIKVKPTVEITSTRTAPGRRSHLWPSFGGAVSVAVIFQPLSFSLIMMLAPCKIKSTVDM